MYWLPRNFPITAQYPQLHAQEQQRATQFTHPERRREFKRSRWLYHLVSGNTQPLLNHDAGNCIWPEDKIGSLSHKKGHIALAFEPRAKWQAVGIDAELLKFYPRKMEQTVLTPTEVNLLSTFNVFERIFFFLVIFSAKEALFKCLYPLKNKRFYFTDASVHNINPHNQTLTITSDDTEFACHYMTLRDEQEDEIFILTTVTVAPS